MTLCPASWDELARRQSSCSFVPPPRLQVSFLQLVATAEEEEEEEELQEKQAAQVKLPVAAATWAQCREGSPARGLNRVLRFCSRYTSKKTKHRYACGAAAPFNNATCPGV